MGDEAVVELTSSCLLNMSPTIGHAQRPPGHPAEVGVPELGHPAAARSREPRAGPAPPQARLNATSPSGRPDRRRLLKFRASLSDESEALLLGRINTRVSLTRIVTVRRAAPRHVAFARISPAREAHREVRSRRRCSTRSRSWPAWPAVISRSDEDERHQPQAAISDVCLRNARCETRARRDHSCVAYHPTSSRSSRMESSIGCIMEPMAGSGSAING